VIFDGRLKLHIRFEKVLCYLSVNSCMLILSIRRDGRHRSQQSFLSLMIAACDIVSVIWHRSLTAVRGGLSSSATGRCGQYTLHTSAWTGPTISSCSGCRRTWQGTSVLTHMTSCLLLFHIYSTHWLASVSRAWVCFYQPVALCNSGTVLLSLQKPFCIICGMLTWKWKFLVIGNFLFNGKLSVFG